MKELGAVGVDVMVWLFTHLRDRTGFPDIDNDNLVFDLPLSMIQHILTLHLHDREDLLKRLSGRGIMVVHGNLAAKGTPAVVEM